MTTLPPAQRLEQLARRIRRRDALRIALVAVAAGLLLGLVPACLLGAAPAACALAAATVALGAAGVGTARRRRVTAADLAAHLDRVHPEFEESAVLLLQPPEALGLVARLQQARVAAAWEALPDPLLPPRGLPAAAAGCAVAIAAATLVLFVGSRPATRTAPTPILRTSVGAAAEKPAPRVEAVEVTVTPPSYTGQRARAEDRFDVAALTGSVVRWRVRLDRAAEAALVFGEGDTLWMEAVAPAVYEATRAVRAPRLYHLAIADAGAVYRTDDYRLAVADDRPPVLSVVHPEVRTVLEPGDPRRLTVQVLADDDLGLARADLAVTRAKGSGESVTFREDVVPFDAVEQASDRAWTLRATLRLDTLGLEPGDGLYVHARAWDRRAPEAGMGRSETFFVVLRDTSRADLALDAAFGVNPLPAYFRSQRQIILDTEALLAARDALPADTFQQRSHALGVDQKILRLRYGQFLGEENESGLAPPPDDPRTGSEDLHDEHDGHDHEAAPPGAPTGGFGTGADAMIAAQGHMHDSAEGATFYADEIEDALKAALAQMWEAELHLRTFRPEEALPYEYQALRMIKDLQEQARIYVQRVGFEPPPLRPDERRLTGELDDVPRRRQAQIDRQTTPLAPAFRRALTVLESLAAGAPPGPSAADDLRAAGTAWAADALETPGRDLAVLGDLRALVDALESGAPPCTPCAVRSRAALWDALPSAEPVPHTAPPARGDLARRYFDALRP